MKINWGLARHVRCPTLLRRRYGSPGAAHSDAAAPSPPKDNAIVGPGLPADSDRVPTDYEHSAGLARIEMLSNLSGRPAFLMSPLQVDHYGTPTNPILVDSVEGRRLAGCTGFPKYSHEVRWLWVDENVGINRCQECGQAFRINKHHH